MNSTALQSIELAREAEERGDHRAALVWLKCAHVAGRDVKRVHVHVHWLTASLHFRHRRLVAAAREAALAVLATVFDRDRSEAASAY